MSPRVGDLLLYTLRDVDPPVLRNEVTEDEIVPFIVVFVGENGEEMAGYAFLPNGRIPFLAVPVPADDATPENAQDDTTDAPVSIGDDPVPTAVPPADTVPADPPVTPAE